MLWRLLWSMYKCCDRKQITQRYQPQHIEVLIKRLTNSVDSKAELDISWNDSETRWNVMWVPPYSTNAPLTQDVGSTTVTNTLEDIKRYLKIFWYTCLYYPQYNWFENSIMSKTQSKITKFLYMSYTRSGVCACETAWVCELPPARLPGLCSVAVA